MAPGQSIFLGWAFKSSTSSDVMTKRYAIKFSNTGMSINCNDSGGWVTALAMSIYGR